MITHRLGAWAQASIIQLRDRVHARLENARNDDGAVTLEYVVIGAAIFVAAVALVGVIVNVIQDRQSDISP